MQQTRKQRHKQPPTWFKRLTGKPGAKGRPNTVLITTPAEVMTPQGLRKPISPEMLELEQLWDFVSSRAQSINLK